MNNLVIPPSPNWYESKILACAADNTIIYGSKCDIVIIKNKPTETPADIKIIPHAHYERVISIDVNVGWGSDNMWMVSCGEDKVIKLWNMQDYSCKYSNNVHTANSDKLIGAVFSGNDKIIAASENGFVSVWRIGTNDITSLKTLFNFKVQVTTLSVCPHSPWLGAFGLKCGLVVLTDLRKAGKILYKMRGHDKSMVSLAWCPLPFNIFPKLPPRKTAAKKCVITQDITNTVDAENKDVSIETADKKKIIEELKAVFNVILLDIRTMRDEHQLIKENFSKLNQEGIENIEKSTSDDKISPTSISDHAYKEETVANEHVKKAVDENEFENLEKNNSTELSSNITLEPKPEVVLDVETNVDYYINQYDNQEGDKEIEEDDTSQSNLVSADSKDSEEDIIKVDNNLDFGVNNEAQEAHLEKEFLLASSSRGGSIYIWRAGTDGRKQIELVMTSKRNKRNYRSADKTWITLCWITPHVLLSSSSTGELLQWDLNRMNKETKMPQRKLVHHDHGSTLFAIAAPIQLQRRLDEDNWRSRKDLFAWTVGQERFLLCTSLQADRTTMVSYPTIGGYVYCLASCPLDPNRLAVGIGDNTAKIWDLSRPHVQCIIMTNLWQKIQSKVLTLAWHPTKENILAYGTFEGRIGLINSNNTSKMPLLLNQYFRTAVNQVVWGPLKGNLNNMGLYACGEKQLVIYDTDRPADEPEIIKIPSNENVSCMSWKPDYNAFSIGTKAGTLLVYNLNLELTATIYVQHKKIHNTVWHPEATAEDCGVSPYNSWLAASTGDGSVVIYDLSKEKGDGDGIKDDYRNVAVLNGHSRAVKCLSWSSYEGGKLVSGSDDGVAQVWDVKTKTITSTFTGHNVEPILTVLWSPSDKNFVISGGKDNCIRIWDIRQNHPMTESDLAVVWKERTKMKQELKKHKTNEDSDNDEAVAKVKRGAMLNLTAKAQNNASMTLEDCKRIFSLCNNEDHERLGDIDEVQLQNNSYFDVTKLFGDKNDVLELLNLEQEKQIQKKKHICSQHMSLWKGDIAETLKESIKNGTVNPWLISMAPMVSPKLWQEACEAYATKLIEDSKSDPFETVSYLLACHKVEEAINVFCNATLYREALALAKCRLAKSDPTIEEVLKKWAAFAVEKGVFEIAAQCYIVLRQYEDAAKLLAKRKDLKTLKFAVRLAEKSGNKELENAIFLVFTTLNSAATADDSKELMGELEENTDEKFNGESAEKIDETDLENVESESAKIEY